ncbi:MAG: ATP-binding cassette domain-containing protein [Rhizobiaceae bacterium]|nr:ATP-binding cassette domain-containing protein [Rhizobiaceae bacterium]
MMPPAAESPPSGLSTQFSALGLARVVAGQGTRMVLVLQALRTLLKLGFSGCTALLVGSLVMEADVPPWLAAAAAALVGACAIAGLFADRRVVATESRVATGLSDAMAHRLASMPARQIQALPAGGLIVAMQRHPEAVAALVVGHRAARTMMAAGPLIAALALLLVSWQSALLVVLLTPVMIIFFALVGETLHRRAEAQERAFGRLAGQFSDRIRALPTILANHALQAEEAKLARRLDAYAANTMGVLRIAFLNAAIIDFFASLSIAMLAVFLGLGHLGLARIPGFHDLALWQSLFILMVAPDFFAPFRRFSEQYHAKAEGEAAAAALDRLFEDGSRPFMPSGMLEAIDLSLPAAGMVAITGPSGAGKTTLLRRLAGVDGAPGPMSGGRGRPSWIGTDSFVADGTIAEAIGSNADAGSTRLELAARSVGLLDDALLPGGLSARVGANGASLSGGQRLRIAVARAILADGPIYADEPTAKLDAASAASIRRALADLAASRPIVVATHDPKLAALALRRIDLPPRVHGAAT